MVRILRRLAFLTAFAALLSVPALAHDGWRHHRSSVVVVVRDHDRDFDDGFFPGRRLGWRGCDLPPGAGLEIRLLQPAGRCGSRLLLPALLLPAVLLPASRRDLLLLHPLDVPPALAGD